MKNLAILVGAPLALWGALLYPSWRLWGDEAILHSCVALALCLVPAVVTFVAIQQLTMTADTRLLATLGATGIRMGIVLGVGLLLHTEKPETFSAGFLYWLLVFYLVILGLEVGLLVRQPLASETPPGPHSVSS
jgi:F0F1-type ATP synthase membrane subunit c/vacuolar-type H+-ATPase subunit K